MPEMDGDEVLHRIREAGYDCRVAMVTAVDPDFDIIDLGFDEYVTKPVASRKLLDTVDRLLRRATYSDTLRRYYALVSTRATLEAEKDRAELAHDDEYETLTTRIDALAAELTEVSPGAADSEEWSALLRTVLGESAN
jgi:DNA-binding response OmpR family regulator